MKNTSSHNSQDTKILLITSPLPESFQNDQEHQPRTPHKAEENHRTKFSNPLTDSLPSICT